MKFGYSISRSLVSASLLLLISLSFAPAQADENSEERGYLAPEVCRIEAGAYMERFSSYQGSIRQSPRAFKELADFYKEAIRERNECLRSINMKFKDDLRAIKSKYEALKGDRSASRALRETQRMSEISAATLARDESIRNLPVLPLLPERPIRPAR